MATIDISGTVTGANSKSIKCHTTQDGGTPASTTTDGSGNFTFEDVTVTTGDGVIIWIDDADYVATLAGMFIDENNVTGLAMEVGTTFFGANDGKLGGTWPNDIGRYVLDTIRLSITNGNIGYYYGLNDHRATGNEMYHIETTHPTHNPQKFEVPTGVTVAIERGITFYNDSEINGKLEIFGSDYNGEVHSHSGNVTTVTVNGELKLSATASIRLYQGTTFVNNGTIRIQKTTNSGIISDGENNISIALLKTTGNGTWVSDGTSDYPTITVNDGKYLRMKSENPVWKGVTHIKSLNLNTGTTFLSAAANVIKVHGEITWNDGTSVNTVGDWGYYGEYEIWSYATEESSFNANYMNFEYCNFQDKTGVHSLYAFYSTDSGNNKNIEFGKPVTAVWKQMSGVYSIN